MKEKVLDLLKAASEFVSGEDISQVLGVSRTAVWKHITALRDEGYIIESQTKLGYRLVKRPDVLYPAEVTEALKTRRLGRKIVYRAVIDSTNHLAKELAELDDTETLAVIADSQTAGKGRLGRQWSSPPGTGIWMSVVLRPPIAPADAPKITLITAVAVAQAIINVAGLRPGIKWPNDILINNRKVCGILTELKADMDRIHYVVAGIGINVNNRTFPPDLETTATSLFLEMKQPQNRAKLAAEILNQLEQMYDKFVTGDFQAIREQWKNLSVNLGQEVTISTLREVISGVAIDINDDGLLMVRDTQGVTYLITAGDVTMRV